MYIFPSFDGTVSLRKAFSFHTCSKRCAPLREFLQLCTDMIIQVLKIKIIDWQVFSIKRKEYVAAVEI